VSHEYGGGIIILEGMLEIHPLLKSQKVTVKALKKICGMSWESDHLDSVDRKFFGCIIVRMN
jgi:hypothetical protein